MSQIPPQSHSPAAGDEPQRLFQLANQLRNAGRLDEAIVNYQQALVLAPAYTAAHVNLGTVYAMRNSWPEAVAAYQKAAALRPDVPEIQFNLGSALECNCQWEEAVAAHRKAVALRPNDAAMHDRLGAALYWLGRLDEAEAAHARALQLSPDLASAHCNMSCIHLFRGDLIRGYREWEWRFRLVKPEAGYTAQKFWDGRDLAGRRIIVQNEAGHGDAIQYFRYAPLVARRGGRVIVRCHPSMVRLLGSLDGVEQLVANDQPIPEFDLHCPLLSLPRVFGTTLESMPKEIPYLRPDAGESERWKARLAAAGERRLNVGLAWAGAPHNDHDRTRSMALAQFAPLAQARGVRFVSLQKGPPAQEAQRPPPGMELIDWTSELNDWADTAALLANLDLLVTVDTAVSHLAGALGKPVWVLLERIPGPLWMQDRLDSPWYPSMRLFRQPRTGDWATPLNQIAAELQATSGQGNS